MCITATKIVKISNSNITVELGKENGLICGICNPLGNYYLADKKGFVGVRYTLNGAFCENNALLQLRNPENQPVRRAKKHKINGSNPHALCIQAFQNV